MKIRSKIISVIIAAAVFVCGFVIPAYAQDERSDDIVILYTNDVHCGIENDIGYDGLMLYKREMQALYKNVILADAGDAIQGGPAGSMSKGAYITELMNAVGYDVAVVGNHEFDYGIDVLLERSGELRCGYVCANFYSKETGEPVFAPYKIIEAGDRKIAFVGAVTPDTLTSSSPDQFLNDNGEYIYGFGENGEIYGFIQRAADTARAAGADYVILLCHLGEDGVTRGSSAPDIVSELTGIDAVIDGHSHQEIPAVTAVTKDGREITVTQAGTKLAKIGKMTISAEGIITTELVDNVPAPDDDMGIAEDTWLEADGRPERYADEQVNALIGRIKAELENTLGAVIGHTGFDLCDSDPETGLRRVRSGETNLGDLCADAYRAVLGTDVSIVKGGALRAAIKAGEITYNDIMTVIPFVNMLCSAEVKGSQILDYLESCAAKYPEESGQFAQVSGMEYTVDESIASSVVYDEKGVFNGVTGEYRVKNVLINGEPLDPDKTYTVAGVDYLLKYGGDKYVLSGKINILQDSPMTDTDAIALYISETLGGNVPGQYKDPYGQGRVKFASHVEDTAADVQGEENDETPAEENPHTGAYTPDAMIIFCLTAAAVAFAAGKTKKEKTQNGKS